MRGKIASFLHALYVFFRVLWAGLGGPKHVCPFYPTCGAYVRECFSTLPFSRALYLSFLRILSCHPWQRGRIDLPPQK